MPSFDKPSTFAILSSIFRHIKKIWGNRVLIYKFRWLILVGIPPTACLCTNLLPQRLMLYELFPNVSKKKCCMNYFPMFQKESSKFFPPLKPLLLLFFPVKWCSSKGKWHEFYIDCSSEQLQGTYVYQLNVSKPLLSSRSKLSNIAAKSLFSDFYYSFVYFPFF